MMKKSSLASIVMLSLVAGCAAEGAVESEELDLTGSDIINGAADPNHPAVVAIGWDTLKAGKTGGGICTGTLVAPRTVLTAGHCVLPPDGTTTLSNFRVVFGQDAAAKNGEVVIKAARTIAHPDYNPGARPLGDNDYAIVLLAADAPVAPIGVATKLPDLVGKNVTHVGFGATIATDVNTRGGSGKKMTVTLPVTAQNETLFRTGNGQSGICNGDSGGPALAKTTSGADVVVGIHSYVDDAAKCLGGGFSGRSDRVIPFLQPYLVKTPAAIAPVTSPNIEVAWNSVGAGYVYSLDVHVKGGAWAQGCQNAGILQNKLAATFTGACPTAAGAPNIAKGTIDAIRIYYSPDGADWTRYVERPFDGVANHVLLGI